jgi:hypothetical protein
MKTTAPSKIIAFGIVCVVFVFMLLPIRYATFKQENSCPNLPNVECGAQAHEKNRPFALNLLDKEQPAFILDLKTTSESQIIHSGADYMKIDVIRNIVVTLVLVGGVTIWLLRKSSRK